MQLCQQNLRICRTMDACFWLETRQNRCLVMSVAECAFPLQVFHFTVLDLSCACTGQAHTVLYRKHACSSHLQLLHKAHLHIICHNGQLYQKCHRHLQSCEHLGTLFTSNLGSRATVKSRSIDGDQAPAGCSQRPPCLSAYACKHHDASRRQAVWRRH